MSGYLIAALVWVVLGTFFYGLVIWDEVPDDFIDLGASYVVWLAVYPLVLLYKFGVLIRNTYFKKETKHGPE